MSGAATGRSSANEGRGPAGRGCGFKRWNCDSSPRLSSTPGIAARKLRSSPRRPVTVTANSGPSANPSVPPVMNTDIAIERLVESPLAITAAWGWNAATPMPPTIRSPTSTA